eukprot:COSAG01_NODE_31882_length_589_cov_25.020408_3_plen_37_part_01
MMGCVGDAREWCNRGPHQKPWQFAHLYLKKRQITQDI